MHSDMEVTQKWLTSTSVDSMGIIGQTYLVIADFHDPIPLGRIWCIWEILVTIQQGIDLTVCMPEETRKQFEQAMFMDMGGLIQRTFSLVNCQEAKCESKECETVILNAIRNSIGFEGADIVTKDRLLEWLSRVATSLQKTEKGEDNKQQNLATAKFCMKLATVMAQQQGKLQEAEVMFQKAMDLRTVHLGANDNLTIESSSALANVYRLQMKSSEAEVILRKICDTLCEHKGSEHNDSVKALGSLCRVLVDQGKFEEAELICMDLLETCESMFGVNDSRTIETLITLSQLSDIRADPEAAADFLKKALTGCTQLYGELSAQTLNTKKNLAGLLVELSSFDEAQELFEDAYNGLKQKLGPTHDFTLQAQQGLSLLQKLLENLGPDGIEEVKQSIANGTANTVQTVLGDNTANFANIDPKAAEEVNPDLDRLRAVRIAAMKGNIVANKKHYRSYLDKLPVELSQIRERT